MTQEIDPTSEDYDPESILDYATPDQLRLMSQVLSLAATRIQTDLPCQTHSERHGRNRALDLVAEFADRCKALADQRTESPGT